MQKFCHPVIILCAIFFFVKKAYSALELIEKKSSVVKIYVTKVKNDFSLPWQTQSLNNGTGTGFIIKGRRILTNAHLVSDSKFIRIQKNENPVQFRASVKFIAHDCDLAILEVQSADFFKNTIPLQFAKRIPPLNVEVLVLGYPLGGERLSITKGVVSRLGYTSYSHSGIDEHLGLQVDAAINPGNSGGPIIFNGQVVGLAFQGLAWADNIGYGIPVPIIEHFLKDVEDGTYDGFPELGVAFLNLRNQALRSYFQLPEEKTGILAYYMDPFGSGKGKIIKNDVLLEINGYAINNDGTIIIDNERLVFIEAIERLQWGNDVHFKVWRDASQLNLKFPLNNSKDPFIYRNLFDTNPQYFIMGGLVFSPITRNYIRTLNQNSLTQNINQIYYLSEHCKIDGHYKGRKAFIVLIHRLAHPINTYMDHFTHGVIDTINGQTIRDLPMLSNILLSSETEYHIIRFFGIDEVLVINSRDAHRANPEIFLTYGIPSRENLGNVQ